MALSEGWKIVMAKDLRARVDAAQALLSIVEGGGGGGGMGTPLNVRTFGATGNGVTIDTASILAADAAAQVTGAAISFPAGTYRISTNTTITSQIVLQGGAKLLVDTGATVTLNQFDANPTQQAFSLTGGGKVVFATLPDQIFTAWFGVVPNDPASDIGIAVNAAINAMGVVNGGPRVDVVLPPGVYYQHTPINILESLNQVGIRLIGYLGDPGGANHATFILWQGTNLSGAGAATTVGADTGLSVRHQWQVTITGLAGLTATMRDMSILLSGSGNADNNGWFIINQILSATSCVVTNNNTAPTNDVGPRAWVLPNQNMINCLSRECILESFMMGVNGGHYCNAGIYLTQDPAGGGLVYRNRGKDLYITNNAGGFMTFCIETGAAPDGITYPIQNDGYHWEDCTFFSASIDCYYCPNTTQQSLDHLLDRCWLGSNASINPNATCIHFNSGSFHLLFTNLFHSSIGMLVDGSGQSAFTIIGGDSEGLGRIWVSFQDPSATFDVSFLGGRWSLQNIAADNKAVFYRQVGVFSMRGVVMEPGAPGNYILDTGTAIANYEACQLASKTPFVGVGGAINVSSCLGFDFIAGSALPINDFNKQVTYIHDLDFSSASILYGFIPYALAGPSSTVDMTTQDVNGDIAQLADTVKLTGYRPNNVNLAFAASTWRKAIVDQSYGNGALTIVSKALGSVGIVLPSQTSMLLACDGKDVYEIGATSTQSFLPSQLGGDLALWYDAASEPYAVSADIPTAHDQSGNAHNGTASVVGTASFQPNQLGTTIPCYQFSGTGEFTTGAFALTQAIYIAYAAKGASYSQDRYILDGISGGKISVHTVSGNTAQTIATAGTPITIAGLTNVSHVMSILFNGAAGVYSYNGAAETVAQNFGAAGLDGLTFGAKFDFSGKWFNAIGELVIVTGVSATSSVKRAQVVQYLKRKWGT